MPHNSLILRSIPDDFDLFEGEVRRLMQSPDPPTALICRRFDFALAAKRTVESLGLSAPGNVAILHEGLPVGGGPSPFPHIARSASYRDFAMQIARMLQDLMEKRELESRHLLIPVVLHDPDWHRSTDSKQ